MTVLHGITVELIPCISFSFDKIPTSTTTTTQSLIHERLGFHTNVRQVGMTVLHGITVELIPCISFSFEKIPTSTTTATQSLIHERLGFHTNVS
jgi:hypothetical protein